MRQNAKKVIKAGKSQWAFYKFFSTFVICLTALVLMSSFYKNDVSSLAKAKIFQVSEKKLLMVPDDPIVYSIRFDFESANITPKAALILKEIIKMLKADKTLQVNIEGHADTLLNENYNLKISDTRANNVRKYLLKHNIKNRITTASFGSTKPDIKYKDKYYWLNRRVDITIYKK